MFNGPRWSNEVRERLMAGDLEGASELVHQDLNTFPYGERNRVLQARGLFNSVRDVAKRPVPNGFIPISLKNDAADPIGVDSISRNLLYLPPGYYNLGRKRNNESTFDIDFSGLPEAEVESLRGSRFGTPFESGDFNGFRLVKDAFVTGSDIMMHAYAFNGDKYVAAESARIAKSYSKSFCRRTNRVIDFALLLPVAYYSRNFFHAMSEMAYGLRFADHVFNFPIIYQEDHFGILPTILRRLGIPDSRLIRFDECRDVIFAKALIPSHPPYFWNKSVFDFFGQMIPDDSQGRKLYVSRRYSTRGPSNEEAVEKALSVEGFDVVYAERLSFDEQIDAFAGADIVVSPHGAALSNIAFMRPGKCLFEIFPRGMLTRDYYMRSRHRSLSYSCMQYDGDVDIRDLILRINALQCREKNV